MARTLVTTVVRVTLPSVLLLWAWSASAQGCSDVLKSGTFQTSQYRQNDYFQQIIISRFLSSSYQSSKSDTTGGFGIPLGEAVMGTANYSQSDYDQKKSQLQSSYSNSVSSSRELDVAVASGDPTIVNAWRDCMKGAGGPSLRFDIQSPTEAFLKLEFFSAPGTETSLTTDINFPSGFEIVSGAECLKSGRKIKAGAACEVALKAPSASATAIVSANTEHGSPRAYLPARMRWVREVKPYRFASNCNLGTEPTADDKQRCADRLWVKAHQQTITPTYTVSLTDQEISEGWSFDTSSAKAPMSYIHRYSPSGMSWCHKDNASNLVSSTSFTYMYEALARTSGNDKGSVLVCMVQPSINLVRERYVPQS